MDNNNFFEKIDDFLRWEKISFLGKSKFVNSFSYWFFIVPFIEKIGYSSYFPFNLITFFICSILFGFSNIVYIVFCPEVIKLYKNPQDFLLKGGNTYKLNQMIEETENEVANINNDEKNEDQIKKKFSELVNHFNLKIKYARYIILASYFFAFLVLFHVFYTNIKTVFDSFTTT